MNSQPIGVFDSGVGGLSVLRELRQALPHEEFLFVADQAHVPYGARELAEVRRWSFGIVEFLLRRKSKLIVVACNTASAAALDRLRKGFPRLPFVGMEPAIKPAAEESRRGVIGVIATEATFQGALFESVVHRYARGVKVVTQTCPGLVEKIEAGEVEGPALEAMLRGRLAPLLKAGIDELVLGCTHYPFVLRTLQNIFGPGVRIIDPAPAIARQTARVVAHYHLEAPEKTGRVTCFTTGDPKIFSRTGVKLLGEELPAQSLQWRAGDPEKAELVEPGSGG